MRDPHLFMWGQNHNISNVGPKNSKKEQFSTLLNFWQELKSDRKNMFCMKVCWYFVCLEDTLDNARTNGKAGKQTVQLTRGQMDNFFLHHTSCQSEYLSEGFLCIGKRYGTNCVKVNDFTKTFRTVPLVLFEKDKNVFARKVDGTKCKSVLCFPNACTFETHNWQCEVNTLGDKQTFSSLVQEASQDALRSFLPEVPGIRLRAHVCPGKKQRWTGGHLLVHFAFQTWTQHKRTTTRTLFTPQIHHTHIGNIENKIGIVLQWVWPLTSFCHLCPPPQKKCPRAPSNQIVQVPQTYTHSGTTTTTKRLHYFRAEKSCLTRVRKTPLWNQKHCFETLQLSAHPLIVVMAASWKFSCF